MKKTFCCSVILSWDQRIETLKPQEQGAVSIGRVPFFYWYIGLEKRRLLVWHFTRIISATYWRRRREAVSTFVSTQFSCENIGTNFINSNLWKINHQLKSRMTASR